MNKDKINDVVNLLVGLQQYEWIRIKNSQIHRFFRQGVSGHILSPGYNADVAA